MIISVKPWVWHNVDKHIYIRTITYSKLLEQGIDRRNCAFSRPLYSLHIHRVEGYETERGMADPPIVYTHMYIYMYS